MYDIEITSTELLNIIKKIELKAKKLKQNELAKELQDLQNIIIINRK